MQLITVVNGANCISLLDTGSQVTTVSISFVKENLKDVVIQDCSNLLTVEGAGGEKLPYHGYIVVDIDIPLTNNTTFKCKLPVLVVPDTKHNVNVPMLVGTNLLSRIPDDKTPVARLIPQIKTAIATLRVQARMLDDTNGVLGSVNLNDSVNVPPFSAIIVEGVSHITVPIRQQTVLLEGVDRGKSIVQGLYCLSEGKNIVEIELINDSSNPLYVDKEEIIARIHQAKVIKMPVNKEADDAFIQSFDLSHLSDEETEKMKGFLKNNRDVFAMNNAEMGCTGLVKHKIELLDSKPFIEKCRPIPPSVYDELRTHLEELKAAGIVTESKSPFCSNIVIARKADGSMRMCVDFRRLNRQTKRDAYNIPRAETLIDCLQGSCYFASLDLLSGYHQVEMEPKDQELTAFTLGPLGFYEYTRMPFGLTNSSSTFQRLVEKVLEG